MNRHSIERTVSVTPTAEELARCFAALGSDEQAHFWDTLERFSQSVYHRNPIFQWSKMGYEDAMTEEAKKCLTEMYEHAVGSD